MEIFKTIEDYPNYEFSNQNRLRNKTTGKFLTIDTNSFQFHQDGKKTKISLSKLKHKYFPEPIEYLPGEIFLIIDGFPKYEISNKGRVYKNDIGTFLTLKLDTTGYYFIHVYKHNKRKKFTIHRLVAKSFIPNPKNLPCIDHIDRNKLNNNVENLRWCTYSENNINRLNNRKYPKNIFITTQSGNEYWVIQINQPDFKFRKLYRTDHYTLEEVKEIRNKIYKENVIIALD